MEKTEEQEQLKNELENKLEMAKKKYAKHKDNTYPGIYWKRQIDRLEFELGVIKNG